MNKLFFEILPREQISQAMTDKMFGIMCEHYENTYYETFLTDLAKKQYVIALYDNETRELEGFSTQEFTRIVYQGLECGVLFSGDTIIDHHYWGSFELPLAFGKLMLQLIDRHPDMPIYWLLISKGARTYKFLPVFFREYFPNLHAETPEEMKEFMHYLGRWKFGVQYDASHGIVKASERGQYLKNNFQPDEGRAQEHVLFFNKINPGYMHGDELLCLTRFTAQNLTPLIKRLLHV